MLRTSCQHLILPSAVCFEWLRRAAILKCLTVFVNHFVLLYVFASTGKQLRGSEPTSVRVRCCEDGAKYRIRGVVSTDILEKKNIAIV